jgi:hypothetical protein
MNTALKKADFIESASKFIDDHPDFKIFMMAMITENNGISLSGATTIDFQLLSRYMLNFTRWAIAVGGLLGIDDKKIMELYKVTIDHIKNEPEKSVH